MAKTVKIIALLLFLIIAVSTLTMGYAMITRQLFVEGDVPLQALPFFGVYITDVEVVSATGIANYTHEYIKPTNLKTDVTVSQHADPGITYRVTVYNNTDVSYWYLGVSMASDYGVNELIGSSGGIFITTKDHYDDTTATFDKNDWVPPQTYRTFYVTYRFGTNARVRDCENMVNFKFGLHMDSVQDEFLYLLNDRTSANGYQYIAGVFNDKYAENGSTVIANIGDDTEIFDAMFGSDIRINIDGVEKPVTVMIERKNIDKNAASGDANGVWRQIGELYEGTCSTAPYEDSGENGMNLSSWIATKKQYNVTGDISYNVGYPMGEGRDVDQLKTIEQLMSATDTEFYNMVNNNSGKLLKPVCLTVYSYRDNKTETEHENPNNKYNPGYDLLKAAFDAIKPYCYIGNGAQEVKLQNANALSRAELIPMLERVQQAYDYYLSVN